MNVGNYKNYPPINVSEPDSEVVFMAHPWIVKMDSAGNVLKDTVYYNLPGIANGILKDKLGGYFLWGSEDTTSSHSAAMPTHLPGYICHLDENFNLEWKKWPMSFILWRAPLRQLENGDVWVSVSGSSNGQESETIIRLSRSGAGRWMTLYGKQLEQVGPGRLYGQVDVAEGINGCLAMTGMIYNIPYQHRRLDLLVIDSNGCVVQGCIPTATPHILPSEAIKFSVYPNPTNGNLTIESAQDGTLYLTNVHGQQIAQYYITKGQRNLQLPAIGPGMYVGRFIGRQTGSSVLVKIAYSPFH